MATTMPPPAPLLRGLRHPSTAGSATASPPKSLADLTPNTTTKKTPAAMASTKGLTHLSGQHKQDSPQIPIQPRPATTTTTTTKETATPPSTKIDTVQFHIYQLPCNFQGWVDDHDLEAPLRHLGLLDVARLQLPTGVPRPNLVSQLIASYDPKKRCGYVWGSRVNVDRESFLRAVSINPPAERRDFLLDVSRASEQFIYMCLRVFCLRLRVEWREPRDILKAVPAAMREVRAGSAHKVDWGKLMWDLVEYEILELPKRDDKTAYFGVYLQRLIWVQHPDVFEFDKELEAAAKTGVEAGINSGIRTWLQQLSNKPPNLVESNEAATVVQVQQQPMEVLRPHLGITLNDDAGLDKRDNESISSTPNDGKMHIDGYNDHMDAQQRFQQGNQQKRARNDKNSGVPSGSAFAVANGSHDIVEIERELKHATSEELREAETFVQVVKLLQEELSAETILHMFE